jgi:hypothetical protein
VSGSYFSNSLATPPLHDGQTQKSLIREERIQDEAIVDAYGPEEQAMSWYYYLENKIHFPFQATCIGVKPTSPLRKGETVEVRRLASEDICTSDMLVLIRWQGRNMAVPLSQLTALIRTNQQMRPSVTGTTGSPRATSFKNLPTETTLRSPAERTRSFSSASVRSFFQCRFKR